MKTKHLRLTAALSLLGTSLGVAAAHADDPRAPRQAQQPDAGQSQQFKVEIEGVTQGLRTPESRQLKIDGVDGEADESRQYKVEDSNVSRQLKIDSIDGDEEESRQYKVEDSNVSRQLKIESPREREPRRSRRGPN